MRHPKIGSRVFPSVEEGHNVIECDVASGYEATADMAASPVPFDDGLALHLFDDRRALDSGAPSGTDFRDLLWIVAFVPRHRLFDAIGIPASPLARKFAMSLSVSLAPPLATLEMRLPIQARSSKRLLTKGLSIPLLVAPVGLSLCGCSIGPNGILATLATSLA